MSRDRGPLSVDAAIVALVRELEIYDRLVAVLLDEDGGKKAQCRQEFLVLNLQSPNRFVREAAMYLLAEENDNRHETEA